MQKKLWVLVAALSWIGLHAQVNYQTGSATFNLPLFNWQDTKSKLHTSMSLSYHSGSGLKTNDVASNVGQGWNLLAGGVISRIQVGHPDDQFPREGGIDDINKYPAGYLYSNLSAGAGVPTAVVNFPLFMDKNRLYKQNNSTDYDREKDYFSFQFNGKSGMFVLTKGSLNGVFLGDSKMKVSYALGTMPNTRTRIMSFTIQDESGLIYRFKNYLGKARVLKNMYTDATYQHKQIQPDYKDWEVYHESEYEDPATPNPYIVNSWYLAEIEDPLTQRTITYTYVQRNIDAEAGKDISYSTGDKNYIVLSRKKTKAISYDLTGVSFPDGHAVHFNYGKPRVDLPGAEALTSVDVQYQSRYVSKFELTTSYLILNRYGTPQSDFQKKYARLCLRSVKQYSSDRKAFARPYEFDYYLGSSAPDDFVPAPFSPMKDIWGYYNGDNSRDANDNLINLKSNLEELTFDELAGLCYLRNNASGTVKLNPKENYARNGLLRQIIYPTGGAIQYEYEANNAYMVGQGSPTQVGGVHVSRTKLTDGGFSNGCDNPIINNYNYVTATGASSLWGVEMPVNSIASLTHYQSEDRYWYWKFPFGRCDFRYKYPGILTREQATSMGFWLSALDIAMKGLDVLSTVTTVKDIITYVSKGTGALGLAISAVLSLVDLGISCLGNNSHKDYPSTTYYNADIYASNPLPVQFSRVEIIENGGGNGKTVMEFTNTSDYDLWVPDRTRSMRQRAAGWVYGLPKQTTVFDASGNKVRETQHVYCFKRICSQTVVVNATNQTYTPQYCTPLRTLIPTDTSSSFFAKESRSIRYTNWVNPSLVVGSSADFSKSASDNPYMETEQYMLYTGRTELDTTFERVFKTGTSAYSQTITAYTYNTNNYQVNSISVTQSNGDIDYKSIRYNDDFTTGVLQVMKNNNITGVPVSISTGVIKSGNLFFLNEKATEYMQLGGGDIKPVRTLDQRTAQPVAYNNWHSYQEPGSSSNNQYFKTTQTIIYDAAGRVLGMNDEGGRMVTNIYDYDDKLVVASVINAEPVTDKVAYTSFETESPGGWALVGTRQTSTAITGNNTFVMGGANALSKLLNSAKAYRLSFWSTAAVEVNGGATVVKSAPVINGFTYYEYDIPQGNASIAISGTATIDELRIYPANARMRTVSYDPVIGKTAEADENNRITYYTYDDMDRLHFIKDDRGNVIKMYEYAITTKKGGCIASFTNLAVREYFIKDNCGAGYEGNRYEYIIPANKYTSAVSQDEVDKLVQQELNTLGQDSANTHGTCTALYYNTEQIRYFLPQTCSSGTAPTDSVAYIVPANRYVSKINTTDANLMALEEIKANGQWYANQNPTCVTDTNPQWEGEDTASIRCEVVSGNNTGYREVLMKDVNPNSPTYNTVAWKKIEQDTVTCPVTTTPPDPPADMILYSINNSGGMFSVELTNTATSVTYYFTIYASAGAAIHTPSIPGGTYDVSITPTNTSTTNYNYHVYGHPTSPLFGSGTGTVTITGVVANSHTDININVLSNN